MSASVANPNELIERIAERVVELLRDEGLAPTGLVDAAEIARRFGLHRDTVYARADELGAIRLGDGPRARLRFDPVAVAERLGSCAAESPRPTPAPSRRRRRPTARDPELLPIRRKS